MYGGKDTENRSRRTHYRGPVLIHASMWWSAAAVQDLNWQAQEMWYKTKIKSVPINPGMTFRQLKELRGHIVGVADIVDCLEQRPTYPMKAGPEAFREYSPWHIPGQFGWKLENARPVRNPVPVKGALGLFNSGYILNQDDMLIKAIDKNCTTA